MSRVIVITGPCGAGKTTISTIVAKELGAILLKADDITAELFPGLENIYKHPEKIRALKDEILTRANASLSANKNVVIDFVVLGESVTQFKDAFGENMIMRALLPRVDVAVQRDTMRDSLTVGKKHIEDLYELFHRDQLLIGKKNFIDNSNESPKETAEGILKSLL